MSSLKAHCALVLMGGGARSAYEVGVLKGLRAVLNEAGCGDDADTFFKIYSGTSAGAMNSTLLACYADQPNEGVRKLEKLWRGLGTTQIFHADVLRAIWASLRWFGWSLMSWFFSGLERSWMAPPRSFLNNAPLQQLLETNLPLWRLDSLCQSQQLLAVALSAYSYSVGRHYLFFQGCHPSWDNSHQAVSPCHLTVAHLMASSAIPLIFPPIALPIEGQIQYFGDGALAQRAPLSAAIHLGGRHLVVITSSEPMEESANRGQRHPYPNFADISGHLLKGMFGDSLLIDIAFAKKINFLLEKQEDGEVPLQKIELLMFSPSTSLNHLVADYVDELPKGLQILLSILGFSSSRLSRKKEMGQQGNLASYLLFHPLFIDRLIALGQSDVRGRKDEVLNFFTKLKVEKDVVSR